MLATDCFGLIYFTKYQKRQYNSQQHLFSDEKVMNSEKHCVPGQGRVVISVTGREFKRGTEHNHALVGWLYCCFTSTVNI